MNWALPTLRAWADAGHASLREISRDDVLTALPASGNPRATTGRALRSIFATLKQRKIIFVDPTTRIDIGSFIRRIPIPADTRQLRAAFTSTHPPRAPLTALIGIHGLRAAEIRQLQLVDVHDGRLHLPNRTIPLAATVKTRLATYLDYRASRWPNTVNPHFFINQITAGTTGPVGPHWVWVNLAMSPQALRQDRIVDETQASGGDLRRICDFFGVTIATAEHYATTLNHPDLNDTDLAAAASSRTQGPH